MRYPIVSCCAVLAGFLNDVLSFNPDTGTWASAASALPAASAGPPPRYRAGFLGVGHMLYLFGGVGDAGRCRDLEVIRFLVIWMLQC